MSSEILEKNTVNAIIPLLEKIGTTLERIEIVLEEKQNKVQESKDARQLMQDIVKYYKETEPYYDIQVGSSLQVYRFRNAICKIKNFRNTRSETKKLYKWIRILEDREFIERTSDSMFLVLDIGQNWGFK
jgi:hypothetical protein